MSLRRLMISPTEVGAEVLVGALSICRAVGYQCIPLTLLRCLRPRHAVGQISDLDPRVEKVSSPSSVSSDPSLKNRTVAINCTYRPCCSDQRGIS